MALRHFPYIASFDASGLTDAANYDRLPMNLRVTDDFILRNITGLSSILNSTGGQFRLIRPLDQPVSRVMQNVQTAFPVIPQIYYPGPDLGIQMSLNAILRENNAGVPAVYTSQLAFHGVIVKDSGQDYEEGKWRTADFIYIFPLVLDWKNTISGVVQPSKQFALNIVNYPFELLTIEIYNANGTPAVLNKFAMQFEDSTQYRLQDNPILLRSISRVGGWNANYPCVPILYPDNTLFVYYILSLVPETDATTYTYHIVLRGMNRIKRISNA